MILRTETEEYLSTIEQSVRNNFRFRIEIGILIELASSSSLQRVFDDLLFYAKFVTKASHVLKRVGSSGEDTVKLSAGFTDGIEKGSALLKNLIEDDSMEVKELFLKKFLSLSHDGMNNLLALFNELSWLKNYTLDNTARRT